MNKLAAIALITAACFMSSLRGDNIDSGEAKRTGQGAAVGTVGVMIYAAIEMLRRKDDS